jgi:hypothetical protein
MRFRIIPLEERVVLDAAGVYELFSLDDYQDDFSDTDFLLDGQDADATGNIHRDNVTLLVVSSQTSDPEGLIRATRTDVEIVYFDAESTTLEKLSHDIADTLAGRDATSIGFANHGDEGEFYLIPGEAITKDTLKEPKVQIFWQRIASFLGDDGRIDLLSCNLAGSEDGLDLVHGIEDLTGFNVAASTDTTSSNPFVGNWDLETDGINAAVLYFDAGLIDAWEGSLSSPHASDYGAGHALDLDGVTDHVTILDSPSLDISGSVTMEAWVKLDGAEGKHDILVKGDEGRKAYSLSSETNEDGLSSLSIATTGNVEAVSSSAFMMESHEWYHVAGVIDVDNGTHSLYVNGELVHTVSVNGLTGSSLTPNNDPLSIGKSSGEGDYLDGNIDEIRLWSSALTGAEIVDNYKRALSGTEDNLAGYWRFTAGSGDVAYDYSLNSNHGSLEGSSGGPVSLILSSFDTERQGWTSSSNEFAPGTFLFQYSEGGNPGGYISTYDLSPEANFWKAPPIFTGNLTSAYGGELSFELQQTATFNSVNSTNDVILQGSDETLFFDISDPGRTWTSYSIGLSEGTGWRVQSTGEAATAAEIQTVLGSLESFEIRAEYSSTFSVVDLDSVEITVNAPDNLATFIHSTAPIEDALVTDQNVDLVIYLRGIDPEGDSVSATITSLPSAGTLLQFDGTPITLESTAVSDANGRVVFRPSLFEYGTPYTSFDYIVTDGTNDSSVATATVVVNDLNDAPTLSVNTSLILDEGTQSIIGEELLKFIDDQDSSFLTTYTVTSLPSHGAMKRLDVQLTVGSTFTQADLARSRLTYIHDDSETTADKFSFRVKDSLGATTETLDFNIGINRINDVAPDAGEETTVGSPAGGEVSVLEDTPNPEEPNIRLTVPLLADGDNLTPFQIRIMNVTGGTLEQSDGREIFFGDSGSLLRLVDGAYDFRFTPDTDRELDAAFSYKVVDPDDSSLSSEASDVLIPITPSNDPPVLVTTLGATTLEYIENGGALSIDRSIALTHNDDLQQSDAFDRKIHGATITITDGYAADQDMLIFSDSHGISGSFVNETGVLTLTGSASVSRYQEALRSVAFYNKSENPVGGIRTISFVSRDDLVDSNPIERDILVTPVDDDPVAIGPGAFTGVLYDGVNDYIDLGSYELGGDFTFESWVNVNNARTLGAKFFDFGDGPGQDTIALGFRGTSGQLSLYSTQDTETSFVNSLIDVPEDTWIHLAVTIEATGDVDDEGHELAVGTIYQNGVELASGELFLPRLLERSNQYLAKSSIDGEAYYDGQMDEVRLWSRALSAEEIITDKDQRLAGDENGLLSYYRFDEGAGYETADTSINRHHAQFGDSVQNFRILAASTFESDSDGWRVTKAGDQTVDPTYQSVGGHDGGYIALTNPDGIWSYWDAPDKFLGNIASAYGGTLHYELRDQGSGKPVEQDDVILTGGGLTLVYHTDQDPLSTEWTIYDVLLKESAGWINTATGEKASSSEMQSVLSDLEVLRIRAEYLPGDDSFHLDNVLLSETDTPMWVDSSAGIAQVVTIKEHDDITITLGGADLELSPLHSKINKLVNLFQHSTGDFRGSKILSGDTNITDPLLRTVFGASIQENTSLTFRVTDDGTDPGAAFTNTETVNIRVTPVNEAPVITLPTDQPVTIEDINSIITGIVINDPDINENEDAKLTVSLSVENGVFSLGNTRGISLLDGDGHEDRTMTFRGSLDDVNIAVTNMVYLSDRNYHGEDTLHIDVSDEGNTGAGGILRDSQDLVFIVSEANDAPEITSPLRQDIIEDDITTIIGVSISDLDIETPSDTSTPIEVTLTVEKGTLSMAGSPRGSTITLTDSLDVINQSLSTLTYQSDLNFHGLDALIIRVNDQQSIGFGNSLEDTAVLALNITPSNDLPVLDLPGEQTVDEDKNLVIDPILISDPIDVDENSFALYQVELNVDHGLVSLGLTSGLSFSEGAGTSEQSMVFRGTIDRINRALASVVYRNDKHYNGQDNLYVTLNDLGSVGQGNELIVSDIIPITINPVDDPYVVNGPPALAIPEAEKLILTDVFISDVDLEIPDILDPSTVSLTITAEVEFGELEAPGAVNDPNRGAQKVSLSGTLQEINDALSAMSYQGNSDFKGSDNLTIKVIEGGEVTATNNIFLTVDAVNDPPEITVPGAIQVVDEEESITITGTSVFDIDMAETISGTFKVTLSVDNGILHIQDTGLVFEEDREIGGSTVTFVGTSELVNEAMANITYTGDLDFNGIENLAVTVNDLGNSGLGGPNIVTEYITIQVNPINDAPIVHAPFELRIHEDEDLLVTNLSLSDVDVEEVENSIVVINLTADHGNLTIGDTLGLTFDDNSNSSHHVTFSGSFANTNAALETLTYRSDLNYNGPDNLTMDVNDQGYGGMPGTQGSIDASGALSDSESISINVIPMNDAPEIGITPSQDIFEDTPTRVEGISIHDLDINENLDSLMHTTLEVFHGTLTITDLSGLDLIATDATDDRRITFEATLEDTANALSNLEYTSDLHYHSDVNHPEETLIITVDDRGNTGDMKDADGNILANNIQEVTTTMLIPVLPVNDAPTLELPKAQVVKEDTDLLMTLSLDDRDILITPDIELEVELYVTDGVLSLGEVAGSELLGGFGHLNDDSELTFIEGTGVNDKRMVFRGNSVLINLALDNLKYHADLNYHGPETINIHVSDLGNTGQGDILDVSGTVKVTVDPVNDQPRLTVPVAQVVDEDTDLTISGINLVDVDVRMVADIELEVTVSVTNGVIDLNDISGLTFVEGTGVGDKTIVFRGTVPAINAALEDINYRGDLHFHDGDQLDIFVTDLGNISLKDIDGNVLEILTDSQSIPITVSPVNDAPVLTVPESQHINEEEVLAIGGLLLDDRDIVRRPDIPLKITLEVSHGTLRMGALDGLEFEQGDGSSGDKILEFIGTVPELNAALASVTYLGDVDYHGPDTLLVDVDDLGNVTLDDDTSTLTDSSTVDITVIPVNDNPLLSVPGHQEITEDTDLTIHGISFDDRDITMDDGILFDVTAKVSHGTIKLHNTNGLTFLDGGDGGANMTIRGTLADINSALDDLIYRGDINYHDEDLLELSISDLGNISPLDADGNPTEILTDTALIEIDITPINDAPLWTVPGLQNIDEDTDLIISGIVADDRDITRRPDIILEASLSVDHGKIFLNNTSSITFISGGDGQASMTFQGTIPAINAAIEDLVYHADLDYHDEDQMRLFISDLGNVSPVDGLGNPGEILVDETFIDIQVIPINDAPTITTPIDQFINEDTDLFIHGISMDDRDTLRRPEIDILVNLSVDHGVLTLLDTTGITIVEGDGVDDRFISFQGGIPALNNVLSTIKYRADENYHGPDAVLIHLDDLSNVTAENDTDWGTALSFAFTDLSEGDVAKIDRNLTADATLAIRVDPVNDNPTLNIPEPQVVHEDTDLIIEGFNIDDRDITMDDTFLVELSLTARNGVMTLHQDADLSNLTFLEGDGITDHNIILRGTIADINSALTTLTYRGDPNYHGEDEITILVDDLGNIGQILPPVEGAISLNVLSEGELTVEAINDPAEITLPEIQVADEDLFHAISGISITDPDITVTPDIELEVTLRVNHGTLSLDLDSLRQNPDFNVVLTQGFGFLDRTLTIRGKVNDLNTTLTTLLYRGDLDYNENYPDTPDVLTVEVNDLGNTGEIFFPDGVPAGVTIINDETLLTTANLDIRVNDINDAPIISVPTEATFNPGTGIPNILSVNEDEVLSIDKIVISDVDVNEYTDTKMTVSLSVLYGKLSLQESDVEALDLTFSEGDGGIDKRKMTFTGTLADINQALAGLEYLADLHYNSNYQGNDFLIINVNDEGNVGAGGPLTDMEVIEIVVNPINDQPDALDIYALIDESPVKHYTVIATFDTTDVDLEDVDLHEYTILSAPHGGYLVHGNQLLIANEALLSFKALSHEQYLRIRTTDPGGLSTEQEFLVSDRKMSEEVLAQIDPEVKVFVNTTIARVAKNLEAILDIDDWSVNFDKLSAGSELAGTEGDAGISEALTALESKTEEVVEEEVSTFIDPEIRFAKLLRFRTAVRELPDQLKSYLGKYGLVDD